MTSESKKTGTHRGPRLGAWIVFLAAAAAWLVYFYVINLALMEGQGLPVGWDLFPR